MGLTPALAAHDSPNTSFSEKGAERMGQALKRQNLNVGLYVHAALAT